MPVLDAPGVVEAQEIAQHGDARTDADAADPRIDLPLDFRVDGTAVDVAGVEAVVLGVGRESGPGRSDIAEQVELQGIEDVPRHFVAGNQLHDGHPQLAVEQQEGGAVPDVLLEAPHIGRQCLVGVILGLIHGDVAVELRADPVIDSAHVID